MTSPSKEILGWIEEPPAGRALHVASWSFDWEARSYEELAQMSLAVADGLLRDGVKRDDAVVIVMPNGPRFVAAVYGAMLAGATPAVVAPPRAFQDQAHYPAHLRHVVGTATPRLILATPELAPAICSLTRAEVAIIDGVLAGGAGARYEERPTADLALLQFTAGSSGEVRAVRVPYTTLAANVAAIRQWLRWTDADTTAIWLPHYHDMGLIGGIVAPLASRCDLWLMSPEQFVLRPLEYLRCFGQRGARLTALPSFGLEYMLRRVANEDLEGMDFSGVKGFIVGAELIDASALTRFCDRLQPYGFPHGALLPAYGLAESTLAVSGVPLAEQWTAREPESGGAAVVGCGPPLQGLEVTVVDEEGRPVPDGVTGEIIVRGTSVADGYRGAGASPSLTAFAADGALHTGDAGFRSAGQLFPIGRLGDSMKIRGRAVFAEPLECELAKLGYGRDANVVIVGIRHLRPVVLWVSERAADADASEAIRLLSRLADGAEVFLAFVAKGGIPRTSSGKPRRRHLWTAFLKDGLAGIVTP